MQHAELKTITVQENDREVRYHFLATVAELAKNDQLTRWVGDHDILLYRYEGVIKALSNICRHFGGPVGYHKAQEGVFTCLWHNWQFSAHDGSCLTYPGYPLRQYALKIVGEDIYVNLLG
jgi:nitrite reductase/ring-hydroxylating ferredoxin subunit